MSDNKTKLKPGDRVTHWFAGRGRVLSLVRACARVRWDEGGVGLAYGSVSVLHIHEEET